ncbi:YegP family protein [Lysobacter enzymogenes]|uniref:YegP family protein n=1 Tax=Lysobacter enzymogenes TaxID=69 RepID=UPI00099B6B6B|nr:YegP family protein [Lysobacter enzymogenes]UZW61542.1 YegP family protein [Lysobacter enzymogenes]
MAGKFVLSKDAQGRYHFVLKATNGQVIFSSEKYSDRSGALGGIESVRLNSTNPSRFEVKSTPDGRYFFSIRAANHQVLGVSQMYRDRGGVDAGIESVKLNAPVANTEHQDA